MIDYKQPPWYKFSSDSLKLISIVGTFFDQRTFSTGLDIGAGCGVIGLELLIKKKIEKLCLLEVQEDFKKYLESNIELFGVQPSVEVFTDNCHDYNPKEKFDLIVSNPPYFLESSHRASPQQNRALCRFYNQEVLLAWKKCVKRNLKEEGYFAFCFREREWLDLFLEFCDLCHRENSSGCTFAIVQRKKS